MKKILLLSLLFLISVRLFAQVTLTTSPYVESFDGIGTSLPPGFSVRTGANATSPGVAAAFTNTATAWNNATGAFKNFASATTGATATTAIQTSATDRALGLRQTANVGDPNGAFVFQLANTTGKKALKLSFNLQSLDAGSPRQATWRVDYGVGAAPTAFTVATATGTLTTGSSSFTNNTINVDFGAALDNNANSVWIRIVTINATTGAGNRPSTAIDNFNLSFTSDGAVATPTLTTSVASLSFGNQSIATNSSAQSFTAKGTNTTANTIINTNLPFSVSKDNTTFSSSVTFTPAEISASPAVYVRYSPTVVGASSGNATLSSTGAPTINVALTGTGVAGDLTPPVTAANYPKTNNAAITSVDLINNINEAGTTYYVLLPSGSTAPTPAQVKAGLNATGTAAFKSGSFANTAGADASATITGLTSGTSYIFYVVAQDVAGNLQTTVASVDAITANPPLVSAPIIISQYYEGTSVNKWIELTNLSNAPVNTASPQLKLALYNISGDGGTINIAGVPSQIVNLNFTIPARGSVLLGNTGNSNSEIPYLTPANAVQNNNTVINFNGNDGVALLDANNNIIDAFGQGINAKDVSYVRSLNVTAPNPVYADEDWTRTTMALVQNAIDDDDANRLGVHFPPNLPVCAAPTTPATALTFNSVTTNSIAATFTKSTDANEYLVIRSLNNTLTALPTDGTVYNVGSSFGGGIVANRIVTNTFTDNGLTDATSYTYFIIPLNNISCTGGPKYLTADVLSASQATKALLPCAVPVAQPTNFTITSSNYNFIQGAFTPANGADEYLVVMSTSNALTAVPTNQTTYNIGDLLGGGIVVKRGAGGTFIRNGLSQNTNYYFFIYSINSACSGGPLYLTNQPLLGNLKTGVLDVNKLNFYYGNLHSHSSYSDGNKDDLTKKPEDDYAFAKNAMNLDFLGISEHNHTQAGMSLASWQPGIDAAKNATTSTFVAMHGMEWGVISGGGHVIVYGIDSLIGWEPGENQIYVPKSVYTGPTGLFRIINRHGLNAIATLAHPNTSDYNNISATYDLSADSAIVGAALESGPAFSTNITYSDPASSMSYLSYYNRMLARGYHLGASIDHDNHNLTFGRHTRARLVVLAPALTENDLLDAIKKMRFYASQDSAAKIVFTINKQPVGSVFKTAGAPLIELNSITTSPVTSIKIFYGTPGSGVNPVELTAGTTTSLTYTDNALANLATGYYYADLVEADGSRIITSPIWYSRDDATVKANQTITLAPTKTVTYGDPDFPIGATSDNTNINITYTSSDPTIAAISNNDVHIVKAGTVTITANQAGDTFFNPAVAKQQVLTIAPKVITVTADAKTKVEATVDPSFTYTSTPSLIGADTFTGTLTRNPGETAGDYAITQGTLALTANYAINYKAANLRIYAIPVAVASANVSVPLNAPAPVITFTASAGNSPFTFTYNINGGTAQSVTSNTNSVTVSAPTNTVGTFIYTVTSITDAYSTQTQNVSTTVKVNPLPVATISGTTALCINGTAPAVTFTGGNGTAPYTFTYNINGGASQTISTNNSSTTATLSAPVNVAGTFNYNLLSVTDVNAAQNQTGRATVTVRTLPTATLSGAAAVSQNTASPTLTFTGLNGTAPYTFTYNINGGANRTVTSSGNTATIAAPSAVAGTFVYNLVAVADVNCSQPQTGAATVTVRPLPIATITGTTAVCNFNVSPVITFTGAAGTAPYTFTYTLNGSSNRTVTTNGTTATLTVPTGTVGTSVYTLVSVTDAFATQTQTGNATITVNPLPVITISSNKGLSVSKGETIILTATGGSQYSWTGADINSGQTTSNATIRPKQSGNYKVIVTNANGCTSEQTVSITVADDYNLEASTVVTPNGDGYNDKFIVKNIDYYPNNTLRIFDKAGRILYTKQAYTNDWDGTVNGSPLAEGTYYYIIDLGTGIKTFKGYINIIRD
ncbi:T9SS type B sorting domain-containing protein [Pedobacter petrophilus]|uniref:T9SS type B sorting domain-containing protein n=1 Tax=Pedobacter petrophilus TaxID=1908241 RepID=A0A7K0G5H7_9SPHI|nr:gliding motility-associated C-terminal domain-containing protein [Pedobacter petrophilus]MRX78720.1 T9SS type B sorting domain-containing protein [Pedobacter petrophilus]